MPIQESEFTSLTSGEIIAKIAAGEINKNTTVDSADNKNVPIWFWALDRCNNDHFQYGMLAALRYVAGIHPDTKDDNGNAGIVKAICFYKNPSLVNFLLAIGAYCNTKDADGNTILFLSCRDVMDNQDNLFPIAEVLVCAGADPHLKNDTYTEEHLSSAYAMAEFLCEKKQMNCRYLFELFSLTRITDSVWP